MNSTQRYCTFYIIRHGESEWNAKGLIEGRGDSVLTPKGERQALLLAKNLKNVRFDVIFSSQLLRAKRTAEIIASKHNLVLETTKVLSERNFGKLEGRPGESIKILAQLQKKAHTGDYKSYGVESDEQIISRMFPFLRKTATSHLGKTVLVVTHGSLLRVLLVHIGHATLEQLPPFSIGNTALVKLESDGNYYSVLETSRISFNNSQN